MRVTLLGTGSPIPDPHRAGPATLVQAVARDGVASQHDDAALVLDAVADGRGHGAVVGRAGGDGDPGGGQGLERDRTVGHLGHLGRRLPLEVLVVGQAVSDVGLEHVQVALDELRGPGRSDHVERRRHR